MENFQFEHKEVYLVTHLLLQKHKRSVARIPFQITHYGNILQNFGSISYALYDLTITSSSNKASKTCITIIQTVDSTVSFISDIV